MADHRLPRAANISSVPSPEDAQLGLDAFRADALGAIPGLAVLGLDRDLRVLFAAGEVFESSIYSPGQLEGQRLEDVMPMPYYHRLEPQYLRALGGETRTFDYLSDEDKWFRIVARPWVRDERIVGVIVLATEITAEKKIEGQLAETADAFAATFDQAPTPMITAGSDGRVTRANSALYELLGYDPGELIGVHFLEFTDPRDVEDGKDALRALLAGEHRTLDLRKRYVRKDGSSVWAHTWLATLQSPGGPPQIVAQIYDLSEDLKRNAALRDSLDLFQAVFRDAPIGTALATPEGRVTHVNRGYEELLGYPAGELVGRNLIELVHPDDRARQSELVGELKRSGGSGVPLESRYVAKDGATIWADVWTTMLTDEDGQPTMLVVQVADVTRRKELETDLQEESGRLEALFDGSPGGIALATPDSESAFVRVNEAYAAMLGYRPEELIGKSFRDITYPEDVAESQRVRDIVGEHDIAPFEKRYLHRDGHPVYAVTSLRTIRDAEGEVLFLASMASDMTAARKAADKLALRNRRYEVAFNSAPAPIGIRDLDGNVVRVNPAFCELVGRPAASIEGHPFLELVHPEERGAATVDSAELSSDPSRSPGPFLRRFLRGDGTSVPVRLHTSLAFDSDGKPEYLIAHVEDISPEAGQEGRLRWQADHDSLTGAMNSRLFHEEIGVQVSLAHRYNEIASLVVLDFDRFKTINDTYGHPAGDAVLQQLVQAIQGRLRSGDRLGRVGGDEFAILLPHASQEQARAVVDGIRDSLRGAHVDAQSGSIEMPEASFGIAGIDPETPDAQSVFDAADRAMYAEKNSKRS